mgnify:CR=1 FL=1
MHIDACMINKSKNINQTHTHKIKENDKRARMKLKKWNDENLKSLKG